MTDQNHGPAESSIGEPTPVSLRARLNTIYERFGPCWYPISVGIYFFALLVALALYIVFDDFGLFTIVLFGFVYVTARKESSTNPDTEDQRLSGFVLKLAVFAGFFAVSVMLVNLVVNPYGDFDHRLFEPLTLDARRDKLALYADYTPAPDVVIFGSSRSFTVSPVYIEKVTDLRAFNASVEGGSFRDQAAFANYMEDRGHFPKVIIIGLSIEHVTGPESQRNQRPSQHDALSSYLDDDNSPQAELDRWLADLERIGNLFSRQQLEDSLEVLNMERKGRPVPHYRFDDNGLAHFSQFGSLDQMVDIYLRDYWGSIFSQRRVLREYEIDYLKRLLALCQKHGTQVIIYLPPYHPRATALYEQGYLLPVKADVLAWLESLQAEYDFTVHDFTYIDSFGGTAAMFHDAVHPTEEAARLMLDMMLQDIPQES